MRPSEILQDKLDDVRATIARFPVANPRLFGSVARGEDVDGSDIDILVDALDKATYYDLAGLEIALAELLGVKVDVATPAELKKSMSERVLSEARPF